MNYLNRFLIEEESQFECDGVFGLDGTASFIYDVMRKINPKSELHVVISADIFSIIPYDIMELENLIYKLKSTNLMITRIGSERLECVQKEEYEKFYGEKGTIQYDPYDIFHYIVRQSIGNAIENFFQAVKMKRIAYNPKTTKSYYKFWSDFWLNRHDNIVTNFHLSMLTDEKENEMLIQRNSGRKCPDFKNDTKLSENVNNYALSICFRKTWIQNRAQYYEIIDPDSTALNLSRIWIRREQLSVRIERQRTAGRIRSSLRQPRMIEEERPKKKNRRS